MSSVVIVAKHPTDRSIISLAARRAGVEPVAVADAVAGLAAIVEHEPALVIMAEDQSGIDTPKLFALLAQYFPQTQRALLTEEQRMDQKIRYRSAVPHAVVQVPASPKDLDALEERLRGLVG